MLAVKTASRGTAWNYKGTPGNDTDWHVASERQHWAAPARVPTQLSDLHLRSVSEQNCKQAQNNCLRVFIYNARGQREHACHSEQWWPGSQASPDVLWGKNCSVHVHINSNYPMSCLWANKGDQDDVKTFWPWALCPNPLCQTLPSKITHFHRLEPQGCLQDKNDLHPTYVLSKMKHSWLYLPVHWAGSILKMERI